MNFAINPYEIKRSIILKERNGKEIVFDEKDFVGIFNIDSKQNRCRLLWEKL